ncbi:hypothetical protein C8J57DRAFT_1487630 [Mycena rebaudengoi]|nr:hypothetical protein C8J57DRAFT_1487630 [Mycena rebaudengoi]
MTKISHLSNTHDALHLLRPNLPRYTLCKRDDTRLAFSMSHLSYLEKTLLSVKDSLLVYVLSFWNPDDILVSATLSTVLQGVVRYYQSLVWDIDKHLQHWFRDGSKSFRSVLGVCGAAVSGSQILQFFDRTKYLDSDLDIFLRVAGLLRMGEWLVTQGYRHTSSSENYDALNEEVLHLSRYVASPTVIFIQKVQLVAVDMDPVHHILFDFHSTAVMGFLTCNMVVSVFPRSTHVLKKSYMTKIRTESPTRTKHWKTKYQRRGFRIIHKQSKDVHADLKLGKRSTTDCNSWVIKLDGDLPFCITNSDSYARIAEPGIWRLGTN